GYSYTAATLWFRAIESAGVVVLFYAWLAPLVRRLLAKLARRAVELTSHGQPEAIREALAARLSSLAYLSAFLFLALLVLAAILEIWGLSVLWIATLPLIPKVLAKVAIIGLVVALAYALVRLSHRITEHFLEQRPVGPRLIRPPGRKLKTLLPLGHTILKVAVTFVAGLAILEQLGVQTGPLLAGIGIFGLAIGFASQSLIKDVINGLFILLEGSLSIGDIVTLRGTSGQVEKFTLRAVTVRDLAGNVHVIPNSVIDVVTNMTKGYSRYVLDVAVAYHEDVDTVTGILRGIDEEMRGEREFAKDILEPIEILGLDRFEESAMVIRARLKTRPLEQWRIGREFQARMKKAFDRRGIEIPFPHRTLYWGVSKEQPVLELESAAKRIERSSG
ncbi:MAG: mechanosensitive ion channel family protein, partial [Candidatus Entotheonellia bacterium]